MVAGDDPALTAIAWELHHSQEITNFVLQTKKLMITR